MSTEEENNNNNNNIISYACEEYFIKGIAILFVIAVLIFAIYWLIITIG